MTVTDEELMAYVDGELDTSRRETLRQAIADSADLSRRVAEQRALRDRLRRAFDPVLKEPLPSRLVDLAARARVSDSGRAARRRWSPSPWQSGWALAAGIALGIVVGPTVLQLASEPADVVDRGVGLTADGALADALSRRLASEQSASDSILLGISFRSKTGEYCRTFISRRGDGTLAGLACRQDPGWRIEALQAVPALSGNLDGYRQAAAPWPSLVLRAAEESMVGDPLDATGEATARDRGWSSSPPTP